MGSFPRFFPNSAMTLSGQNSRISTPEIGVTHGTLPIDRRQRLPQAKRTGFIT
jgi:hypothetical protein